MAKKKVSPAQGGVITAQSRYQQLESARSPFLDQARVCSNITIPALVPPEGQNVKLTTPYQGIGARGVNNLAAKLLMVLLPPNASFFRLKVDTFTLKQMSNAPDIKTLIDSALSEVEKAVMDEVEVLSIRVAAFEALKHLIVAGNVLIFVPPDGGIRVFHLPRYVVKRDPMGNVLEIITRESIAPSALPADILAILTAEEVSTSEDKSVDLYTRIVRVDGKYEVYQEVAGHIIPQSKGSYPLDKCPWIPLRFTRIDGEDYGRGFVEEYLGDLNSLEKLEQSIVEGSLAASKVLFGVKPNGTTSKKAVAEAPNCGIITADFEADVTTLQLQKFNDFKVAKEEKDDIAKRLAFSFLLNSSVQRPGERVTAEEIRFMANELETALGGVYSILSQEFQLPLVNVLMAQMTKTKRLPRLPKGIVKPSIVTGLEALGRGHDLNKLDLFLAGAQQTLGPELVAKYLNVSTYLTQRATAVGIDTGLIKTPEQIQAEEQQANMMAVAQSPIAGKAVEMMAKQNQQEGTQQ